MAKAKTTKIETPSSDRQARWDAFLTNAQAQNPEKFAVKKKAGVFDNIPDSFL